MLFGHLFTPHAVSFIEFRCGACANSTVGAELALIVLSRGSTRRSDTPLRPFVYVWWCVSFFMATSYYMMFLFFFTYYHLLSNMPMTNILCALHNAGLTDIFYEIEF